MANGETSAADRTARFPIGAAVTLAELNADPYPAFHRLRESEPISWIPALGMYYVTRYDLVEQVLLDAVRFQVGGERSTIEDTFGRQMLTVEGAEHDRMRGAMQSFFSPRIVRSQLEAGITASVDKLIDEIDFAKGEAELRSSFAQRLPVLTMLLMFGLPAQDEGALRAWYDSFEAALANLAWDESIRRQGHADVAAFHKYLASRMTEQKSRNPPDSLLSTLLNAPTRGRLDDEEIMRNASIVLFGGISTVEALILNAVYALSVNGMSLAQVRQDPTLVGQVVDETGRWLAPVQAAARVVLEDVEIEGVTFKKGDIVSCMLGAASRDPAVFPDPDRFFIERPNARRHLGFARGPHHCLGVHLARAQAQIALTRLADRLPNCHMNPAQPSSPEGYEFRQPKELHIKWDVQP